MTCRKEARAGDEGNVPAPTIGSLSGARTLRHIALVAMLLFGVGGAVFAEDPGRCRDVARNYETNKPQLTAIEISSTLFAAADRNCINLAMTLLERGASVDARDRLGARPLSRRFRNRHHGHSADGEGTEQQPPDQVRGGRPVLNQRAGTQPADAQAQQVGGAGDHWPAPAALGL